MSNDDTEVDLSDKKTSKLEVGLKLATIFAAAVTAVWGLAGGASVIVGHPNVNPETAKAIFDQLTPIVTATGLGTFIAWVVGKNNGG